MNKLLQDVLGDQQIGDLRVIKKWAEQPYITILIEESSEAWE